MNWFNRLLIIIPLVMFFTNGCQTSAPIPNSPSVVKPKPQSQLKNRIDSIINETAPTARIGLQIISMKTGEVVYERNPHQLFLPASVLKLYTTAAALYYLSPSYRFETRIFADGFGKNKVGNLYVRGSGDPNFSIQDLQKIALMLKQSKVKGLTGDIVIDDSQFDGARWGSGWMWDDMHKGFSAPIGALNVDFNRIAVFVWPGFAERSDVRVTVEPFTRFIKPIVSAKTTKAQSKNTIRIGLSPSKKGSKNSPSPSVGLVENQEIYISGDLPRDKPYVYETFSIKDPSIFAGYLLKEQLKNSGIEVKGRIRRGDISEKAQNIDTIFSKPLGESIIRFVKMSNNQATEVLLKTIGLKFSGTQGSFESGIKATQQFLQDEVKMDTNGLVCADGSGLSRYNQTTPAQMNQLLRYMWNNFRIGPEFISALAIAGQDGTLNHHWQNSSLNGRMRGKTGSMSSVQSLVGYLDGVDGEVFSFAIMINGHTMNANTSRELIDKILNSVSCGATP